MFKFALRDVLWLTLFVAFCLHAWIDRSARHSTYVRRVREESIERAEAQERAEVAEAWAARYEAIARRLQIEAIMREVADAKDETASTSSR